MESGLAVPSGRAFKCCGAEGLDLGPLSHAGHPHSRSVSPLASSVASLSLSVFICKTGLDMVITLTGRLVKIK